MKAIATVVTLLAAGASVTAIVLPGSEGGIGFDDLRYSPELHKLLVPAGRTGRLDLVDPKTHAVEAIAGFSGARENARGHSQGTTSADSGEGLIFASDRADRTVVVVDPAKKQIVARANLAGGPDYVRWVAPLREVWVSEPDRKVVETFRFEASAPPALAPSGTIEVPDGPESLEIDVSRRRAYTNTWHDTTIAIDLDSRTKVAQWPNQCQGARGLALDGSRGLLFVGCKEGKAVALDVEHGGAVLGSVTTAKGVDIVAFAGKLSHLYVPGAADARLTVVGVGARGKLEALGTIPTAADAHCVAVDDDGSAYVCDPGKGRLLVIRDPYPATR
jgi:hypothetical protein